MNTFIDGNSRTSRLLLNFELLKYGYTPIIINKDSNAKYYKLLDYQPFIEFIDELLVVSEQL